MAIIGQMRAMDETIPMTEYHVILIGFLRISVASGGTTNCVCNINGVLFHIVLMLNGLSENSVKACGFFVILRKCIYYN